MHSKVKVNAFELQKDKEAAEPTRQGVTRQAS